MQHVSFCLGSFILAQLAWMLVGNVMSLPNASCAGVAFDIAWHVAHAANAAADRNSVDGSASQSALI